MARAALAPVSGPKLGANGDVAESDEKGGEGLQSVIMTVQILEQVARSPRGVGVTGLANMLGTSKSRVHRHLQTLVQQGYVTQPEDSERYEIGPRLVALGQAVFDSSGLLRAAQDPLLELRDCSGTRRSHRGSRRTGCWSSSHSRTLGHRDRRSRRIGPVLSRLGAGQGRDGLLVAGVPGPGPAEQARALHASHHHDAEPASRGVRPHPEAGVGDRAEPDRVGLNTLACPVFDASGRVCGAVGIVDMVQQIDATPSELHVRQTRLAARRISERLGFAGTLKAQPAAES